MSETTVTHDETNSRGAFRIGRSARMTYRRPEENVMTVDHTVVDEAHRGQGLAQRLYEQLIAFACAHERKVEPVCPFVRSMFERHPEHADLLHR